MVAVLAGGRAAYRHFGLVEIGDDAMMRALLLILGLSIALSACATRDPFTQGALMVQMGMH